MLKNKNVKTNFTEEQLNLIKNLYDQDFGSRKIAKILKVNRSTIIRAYKQLNLDSYNKKTPKYAYKQTEKICKICNENKSVNEFRKRVRNNQVQFECYCKVCEYQLSKEKAKIKAKKLRKTDPHFVIKRSISYFVWKTLNRNNSSKNNQSSIKYIKYSIQELKENLESKFESWMTWQNYGTYNKNIWKDDDLTTWRWNIDHIIPQSDLPYISMEDENFKKCWSLENLRPLSAKQNLLEGVNKIRHNII